MVAEHVARCSGLRASLVWGKAKLVLVAVLLHFCLVNPRPCCMSVWIGALDTAGLSPR